MKKVITTIISNCFECPYSNTMNNLDKAICEMAVKEISRNKWEKEIAEFCPLPEYKGA